MTEHAMAAPATHTLPGLLKKMLCPVLMAGMLLTAPVQASIILSSSRVIFDGTKKEANVTVRNVGNDELLIQSWLDDDKPVASSGSIPFAVTPPLVRMAGQSRQILRILFQGSGVPADKESVFWLNVQEIPRAPEEPNVLQLAVRQRIKMFYRPAGIAGSPKEAPASVSWQVEGEGKNSGLRVDNPTSYHVTFSDINLSGAGYKSPRINNFMIAPGTTLKLDIPELPNSAPLKLSAQSINDYGAKDPHIISLNPAHTKLKHLD